MTTTNDMREQDKSLGKLANPQPLAKPQLVQRFHRGPMGNVLQRYINSHSRQGQADYSALALEQLWDEAARHDPAIGLHLFGTFTPQDWHVIALAGQYCDTVQDAMENWARYAGLASDMDMVSILEDANGIGVELNIDAPINLVRYLTEHYFVMALTVCIQGSGHTIVPACVQLAYAKPAYYSQYSAFFGSNVSFECARTRMYLDSASLSLPMHNRHPGILSVLKQELDRCIARQKRLAGWSAKVAHSIRHNLAHGQVPTLDNQAELLHQSPRTLRRRLEHEGISFRQLLDLVRADIEQYLELQGESRADIAEQLGYSDLTAYLHARKRWRQ
ncbi:MULTISPECIES: AraC family transcriptional regulator ligand-binding domain-containing protein [Pseudomonas]|uniref:AraC family transcriptional regulator ligand-binding domain-containing protein n=1 Tax=Pseudomonas TaxID=286 RepID=UPI000908D47D|nr:MULTISPECIES: AraC family transcriptional regulator ligand-binding domain-containing protein [Pseudomonas]TCV68219.1 AraC-type transcriptional regulator [Pseudomonas fluorescens]SFW47639.1 Arabinose-binding domain of AraC transcription regulator, N-term [Pseudomonas sp. NFACC04-2]